MSNEEDIWKLVDNKSEDYIRFSDRVFDTPEILYKEFKSVSEHTQMLKQEGFNHQYYIKLQGRLGKNNPNAWKYEAGENSIYGGNYCGHWQSIRLQDAAHADAYIYKRNPY